MPQLLQRVGRRLGVRHNQKEGRMWRYQEASRLPGFMQGLWLPDPRWAFPAIREPDPAFSNLLTIITFNLCLNINQPHFCRKFQLSPRRRCQTTYRWSVVRQYNSIYFQENARMTFLAAKQQLWTENVTTVTWALRLVGNDSAGSHAIHAHSIEVRSGLSLRCKISLSHHLATLVIFWVEIEIVISETYGVASCFASIRSAFWKLAMELYTRLHSNLF